MMKEKDALDGNICLIGYMGSGKSTVGRMLAGKLDREFMDTDDLITENEGRSIPEIFRDSGEPYFRGLEYGLLKRLADEEPVKGIVLATGGGIPVDERNRALLKKTGTVIYLRSSAESLCERVGNDTNRPLLNAPDRLKKIREMLKYRGPLYEECADIIIDTDEMSAEETVDYILKLPG